jgi:hypothetical protein
MGEHDVGQRGWQAVELKPRLTRSGAREAAARARVGSRRPATSPFGFHVEAPAPPSAAEFLMPLSAYLEAAPACVETAPVSSAPQTLLSRIAPLLTAGLLGVVVALMLVLAVAAPR